MTSPITITATVTDAIGTVFKATTTASQTSSSTWNDGLANAPSGTPQNPTLLNNYPAGHGKRDKTIANYQPPFNVPGVDYRVGIQTGVVLKSITGNVPAGCTWDGATLTTTGTNVVIDGIDFPTPSTIRVNSASGTVRITNCRLHGVVGDMCLIYMAAPPKGAMYSADVYIGYCELLANGCSGANNAAVVTWAAGGFQSTGTFTIEYCWVDQAGFDCFRPQGGYFHFVLQYNYISNGLGGGHPDVVQQYGTTKVTSKMWNNCAYSTHGSQGMGTDPGNIPPCITSQNVSIFPSGNAYSIAGTGFNAPPYWEFNNNYCANGGSPSGGFKFVYGDTINNPWVHHVGNYWMAYGQGYYN